ncbi:MAG: serine hydrolase [Chloroflexi bacterium]|nr:serine hydrolase [Chloroflexota bacterium]
MAVQAVAADADSPREIGHYDIVGVLGHGGMATVYRGIHRQLRTPVAIKVMATHLAADPVFSQRFVQEAQLTAKLRHANIITIHDFGDENGRLYLVMDLIEGPTLKEMLGRPLDLYFTVDVIRQLGEALDVAHASGVVHRDLKPSNVLMEARETYDPITRQVKHRRRPILTDFGIAKALGEARPGLTSAGVIVGTPDYMSPEQALGQPIDHRSDIYSLGVMLFEMLTGSRPFPGPTPMAVITGHLTSELPSPRSLNAEIPPEVEEVVIKATAKRPGDRYSSAGELAWALQTALERALERLVTKQSQRGPAAPPPVVPVSQALGTARAAVIGPPPLPSSPEAGQPSLRPAMAPGLAATPSATPVALIAAVVGLLTAILVLVAALTVFTVRGLADGSRASPPAAPSPAQGVPTAPPVPAVQLAATAPAVTPTATAEVGAPPPPAAREPTATVGGTVGGATVAPPSVPQSVVPPVAPAPTLAPERVTQPANRVLIQEVTGALGDLPAPATAVFQSLTGPERVERDATTMMPAASTIKLAVMIEVFRQESQGRLSLSQRHTVTPSVVVGGTGVLQNQVGRTLTTRELLEVTLTYSDNTGGNMLIGLVGRESVDATMGQLGFYQTRLARRFMDLEAQRRGDENLTSARDSAEMLRQIQRGELVSRSASAEMLRILRLRGERSDPALDYLGRRLNPRPVIAHLNGTLTGVRCDAGLVELGDRAYVVAIYLRDQRAEAAAEDAIARASERIFKAVAAGR